MSESQDGYIKIYRKFFDHFLWTEDREFTKAEAWIWILKEARYKEGNNKKLIGGKIIEWGRGELPASLRFLKGAWNWGSTTKVQNFLNLLEDEDMIKTQKKQGQNVISVCKYMTYNPLDDLKNTAKKHQKDSKKTEGRHRKDRGKTEEAQNSKKGNKGNKGNKGKKTNTIGGDQEIEIPDWDEFWAYAQMRAFQKEYARHIYDDLLSAGWRDHLDRPVRKWRSYLNKQHKYQHKWMKNNAEEIERTNSGESETETTYADDILSN